jgi:hypothetical protein
MLLDDEAKARTKAAVKAALTPNDEEINMMVDAARESLPIANPLGLAPMVGNAVVRALTVPRVIAVKREPGGRHPRRRLDRFRTLLGITAGQHDHDEP